jgi:hypothetical protein
MKLTKTNNETKTVTAHSLYLDYIKKVILRLSDFTSWTFKTVSFGNVEPYEISEYTLNNSYAIINLSQKTIEIKSLGGTKNLYLFDNQLLYGLTIRLEKLKRSSNNYDFVLSLKNMISDDLSKSFWEGAEPSFSTQEGKFQNLIPMNMFSYINPNFKDKDLFDDDILEIIRTLFLEENVENTVMSKEPENLSRYILSTVPSNPKKLLVGFEYYLNYFSKELILKSFAANNKSNISFGIQTYKHIKALYDLLFVNNNFSTKEDIKKFKEMFVSAFFSKNKGPQKSNRIFLRNEEHDGKEFYSLNVNFSQELLNLQDDCFRLGCKHIGKFDEDNLDISEFSEEDFEAHNKQFENLQFAFTKALEFLNELVENPVLNIYSIENGTTSKYSFDTYDYELSPLLDEIKMLSQFFIPVYRDIKSRTNIEFVFNEDDDHIGIFYNTKSLEKDLKEESYYTVVLEEILLELEQLFNGFSEIISEENRDELELFQMDLELWKKKVAYFKKVNKKEVYRFVKDKG